MHKLLFILVICVFTLVNTTNAAQAIQPRVETPPEFAGQPGCYSPHLKRVLPYNEPYSPADGESCIEYNCSNDGNIYIHTCGALGLRKGEEIIAGNKTLPYPKCCDTVMFTADTSEN